MLWGPAGPPDWSPQPTDKCCCGHPRSEHWLDPASPLVEGEVPKEKANGACAECARMVYGLKCAHFTKSYRIIDTDNFGGDYPNEKVIASGITYKRHADIMVEALNAHGGPNDPRFYRVVEDDYELQPGFEP
jgi:hypothetical protein